MFSGFRRSQGRTATSLDQVSTWKHGGHIVQYCIAGIVGGFCQFCRLIVLANFLSRNFSSHVGGDYIKFDWWSTSNFYMVKIYIRYA